MIVLTAVLTSILAFFVQLSTLNDESSLELHAICISSVDNVAGIFFAWLILVFECGTFKLIDNFVAHKLWKQFGKLNFCIYMFHPIVLVNHFLTYKKPIDFSATLLVISFFRFKIWMIFQVFNFRPVQSLQFSWFQFKLLLSLIF